MSRHAYFVGLTKPAIKITENLVVVSDGDECTGLAGEVVHTLRRWCKGKKTYYREYVQYEIWQGGPNIYTALMSEKTGRPLKESLWRDEDVGLRLH